MKHHMESLDKRFRGREMALKKTNFPSQGFSLFTSVKTCSIVAPQCVFSSHLVYKHPSLRGYSGDIVRTKELRRLMDMMDNSPLRSKLTTYPQPLLPFLFFKRRRTFMSKIADRGNIIPSIIVKDFQLTIDSKLPL